MRLAVSRVRVPDPVDARDGSEPVESSTTWSTSSVPGPTRAPATHTSLSYARVTSMALTPFVRNSRTFPSVTESQAGTLGSIEEVPASDASGVPLPPSGTAGVASVGVAPPPDPPVLGVEVAIGVPEVLVGVGVATGVPAVPLGVGETVAMGGLGLADGRGLMVARGGLAVPLGEG